MEGTNFSTTLSTNQHTKKSIEYSLFQLNKPSIMQIKFGEDITIAEDEQNKLASLIETKYPELELSMGIIELMDEMSISAESIGDRLIPFYKKLHFTDEFVAIFKNNPKALEFLNEVNARSSITALDRYIITPIQSLFTGKSQEDIIEEKVAENLAKLQAKQSVNTSAQQDVEPTKADDMNIELKELPKKSHEQEILKQRSQQNTERER